MKPITKFVHKMVYNLHLEGIFLKLGGIHPLFLKFLPLHKEYQPGEKKIVKRNGVTFELDVSDYMQWYVFARQPDNSWREADTLLKDHTNILDIGANCGAFSLSLAQQVLLKGLKYCKVYAFEPNPYVFEVLKKNLSLNPQLSEIVVLEQLGAGDAQGEYGMVFDPSNSGHGHVVAGAVATDCKVAITTLDNYVTQQRLENVCFVKIDVEGYEPLVLKGAIQLISKLRPALFLEITESWFKEKGYSQKQIFENLASLGYSLFAETNTGFVKIYNPSVIFSLSQFNMLAVYDQ